MIPENTIKKIRKAEQKESQAFERLIDDIQDPKVRSALIALQESK